MFKLVSVAKCIKIFKGKELKGAKGSCIVFLSMWLP